MDSPGCNSMYDKEFMTMEGAWLDLYGGVFRDNANGYLDLGRKPIADHIQRVATIAAHRYSTHLPTGVVINDIITAALGHEFYEQQGIEADLVVAGVSPECREAIRLLTRDADVDYEDYIKSLASNPIALRVKLADLEDNLDVTRLKYINHSSFKRLIRYHRAYQKLLRILEKEKS